MKIEAVPRPGPLISGPSFMIGPPALTPSCTSGADGVVRFVLVLDDRWYRFVWVLILFVHGVCAVYLISTGMLYLYMDHPYLTYFADLLAPAPDRHFGIMATAMVLVACGHLASVVEMVVVSIANRQLSTRRARDSTLAASSSSSSSVRSTMSMHMRRQLSSFQQFQRLRSSESAARIGSVLDVTTTAITQSIWRPVFSRSGLLGVESEHFELVFAMRELIEIGFQTLQAYRTSQMITRAWINALFVALVTANCWTTPLWQHFFRHTPARCRLLCIASDIVLNVCTNMVIPWVIFRSYFYEYDRDQYSFDLELVYDDIGFTNLVMENRLLFALSTVDFLSKLIPHMTILTCLISCKSLLARNATQRGQVLNHSSTTQPRGKKASGASQATMAQEKNPRRRRWTTNGVHVVFLLWGATLLGIHLHAAGLSDARSKLVGCKQFIRPWFVSDLACATYEHNCHRIPLQELPLSDALHKIYPSTLLNIIVSHCQDLVMPSAIQRFPNLLNLEFYNVTLRDWPSTAALSPAFHHSLIALLFIRVNMTAFPDGIRGPLSPTLTDVEIAYTNLTYLPADLHARWHPMAVLYVEYSELREFPQTLTQLEIYDLSLIGNRIEEVPELATISFAYYFLALSHNPIRALPSTIDNGAVFGFLALEHTALTALPAWVADDQTRVIENVVYLQHTPVCVASTSNSTRTLSPRVTCVETDPRGDGRYPLAMIAPKRKP